MSASISKTKKHVSSDSTSLLVLVLFQSSLSQSERCLFLYPASAFCLPSICLHFAPSIHFHSEYFTFSILTSPSPVFCCFVFKSFTALHIFLPSPLSLFVELSSTYSPDLSFFSLTCFFACARLILHSPTFPPSSIFQC